MKNLLRASKLLLLLGKDSTFVLHVVYPATKNMVVAGSFGTALGVMQIGWEFLCDKRIDTMQYLSLFLIRVSGLGGTADWTAARLIEPDLWRCWDCDAEAGMAEPLSATVRPG